MRQPFSTGDAICLGAPTAGRMSKRSRKAALKRLHDALFPDGIPAPRCPQPTERERLLREAQDLRTLAARGMHPRSYVKRAEELEARAESL